MANPSTRQGLIDYCLRSLGHPVIEINIDDDQIEDRIDEALQLYREYHYDAVELVYLAQKIVPSTMLVQNAGNSMVAGDIITGSNSGATCTVVAVVSDTELQVKYASSSFQDGELITTSTSAVTSNLASSGAVTLGNYDNKYFTLDDSIYSVIRTLPLTAKTRGIDFFDARYQIILNDLYSIINTDMVYYNQLKQHLELLNQMLVGIKPIRFNRHMNRLYVDMNWQSDVVLGDYVIVEAYKILDPDTYTDVYNDWFLKQYATALIKRQWGANLKKFEGVQLPGGVTLNGKIIFEEAIEEIKALEQKVESVYQLPTDFFVG